MKITRVDENGSRHYVCDVPNDKTYKGISITSFINLFTDKSWYDGWINGIIAKIPDVEFYNRSELIQMANRQANEITLNSQTYGTSKHAMVEKYLIEKVDNPSLIADIPDETHLSSFLNLSRPLEWLFFDTPKNIAVELKVFYNQDAFSIGGTLDSCLKIDTTKIKDLQHIKDETFIVDWKFPTKPKYQKDVANYMLQLAIYREALHWSYDYYLTNAIIAMSPKQNAKKTKYIDELYLYYLDEEKLNYFTNVFTHMIMLYLDDEVDKFNWKRFVEDTKSLGMLAERIYL